VYALESKEHFAEMRRFSIGIWKNNCGARGSSDSNTGRFP
jgi:hypothetical protein